jgi:hypothetical protein
VPSFLHRYLTPDVAFSLLGVGVVAALGLGAEKVRELQSCSLASEWFAGCGELSWDQLAAGVWLPYELLFVGVGALITASSNSQEPMSAVETRDVVWAVVWAFFALVSYVHNRGIST